LSRDHPRAGRSLALGATALLALALLVLTLLVLALSAAGAKAACGPQQEAVELALARPAAAHEAVWLQVRVGALMRGEQLRVLTSAGELVGTVAPFGAGARSQGGTYTFPLPKAAVVDDRVQLCIEADAPGAPGRAPRPGEVEAVTLIYVPVSN
jgi:hypothetical protein